ncbi:MAG: hypothetical protein A2Y00_06025 [Omnitrophica WOR_2 bacterium GWF2_43_52]|nr:MAG: hypothetical protein A2Y00_06025 [Omnitrophica WOR_2 bacterium GWF2_43_52]OGX58144.1 MAG: hypothetical protein A2460_05520 [Omnitrophica WOR_2 bacterium RIFOXYC2_FULL_43_9]
MGFDIKLTAYSQESESYRIDRLNRVVGYVSALAEHYGNNDLLKKLVSLHDHKGELTVEWNNEPVAGEKEYFAKAWANMCEPSENITHKVVSK